MKLASSFPDDHVPPPLYKSVNCPETNLGEYNRYVLTRASSPLSSLIRRSAVSPRSIRPGLLCRRLESRGHCSRFSRMILTDARGIVIHKTKYTRGLILSGIRDMIKRFYLLFFASFSKNKLTSITSSVICVQSFVYRIEC